MAASAAGAAAAAAALSSNRAANMGSVIHSLFVFLASVVY
jgi:hypothetical protein